jgi:hypothetical protein
MKYTYKDFSSFVTTTWKLFLNNFDTKSTIWKYFFITYFRIFKNVNLNIIVFRKKIKISMFFWKMYLKYFKDFFFKKNEKEVV